MSKSKSESLLLSRREQRVGWCFFLIHLLVLPGVLLRLLAESPTIVVNTCYYAISLAAVLIIFRRLLLGSVESVGRRPLRFLLTAAVGFPVLLLANELLARLLGHFTPDFQNVNNQTFQEMARGNLPMTLLCCVLLVPPVEECLFRGLLFRGLYPTGRIAAYCVSVLGFCTLHVLSYLSFYSGTTLLLCFLQYIPSGLVLAWSFDQTDSIFAPILIHAAVNAVGILSMR